MSNTDLQLLARYARQHAEDAFPMNEDQRGRKSKRWLVFVMASPILIALTVLAITRSTSAKPATITIDANGRARLGIIPLQNKMVRDLTLRALGHIQSGTGSLVVANSASYSNVMQMFRAMRNAGITNCAFSSEPSGSIQSINDLRRRQSKK